MEGWVGLVGRPIADTLPTKGSHVNNRWGADHRKSPAKHRRPNHWATPPTNALYKIMKLKCYYLEVQGFQKHHDRPSGLVFRRVLVLPLVLFFQVFLHRPGCLHYPSSLELPACQEHLENHSRQVDEWQRTFIVNISAAIFKIMCLVETSA